MEANNVQKMREALEKCSDLAETIWQSEGGWYVSAEIAELKDRIAAALSAPPRNCDRFPTRDAAVREYLSHTANGASGATVEGIVDWLFATAEKGAGDEQK